MNPYDTTKQTNEFTLLTDYEFFLHIMHHTGDNMEPFKIIPKLLLKEIIKENETG